MKILMVGSAANVGPLLKRGLERRGHTVVLAHNLSVFDDETEGVMRLGWGLPVKRYGDGYDVVHVHSPNLKKLLVVFPYWWSCVPVVCHWHGSDLRLWWKGFPVRRWFMRHAKMNLYSTLDLAWWIHGLKRLVNCPVDIEVFKPGDVPDKGLVTFDGGGRSFSVHRILHKDMPEYLRRFSRASVHNAQGLDDGLFSVVAFEAAACGLDVVQFPWMDREWVVQSASVGVIAEQVEDVYEDLIYLATLEG